MLTPLSGAIIGPVGRQVLWRGSSHPASFRLLADGEGPEGTPEDVAGLLDLLSRTLLRFGDSTLPEDAARRRVVLGRMPTALLTSLAAAYHAARDEPLRQLGAILADEGFRDRTRPEWLMLRGGLVARPEPSPYYWAFCFTHLLRDRQEGLRDDYRRDLTRAALAAMAYHSPKDLQARCKDPERTDTPETEVASLAERDRLFMQMDPVFGEHHEVPDELLAMLGLFDEGSW